MSIENDTIAHSNLRMWVDPCLVPLLKQRVDELLQLRDSVILL
jgi:hypothetical protein